MRIDHYDLQGEVQYRQQQAQSRKVRNLGPVAPAINPPKGNRTAAAGERSSTLTLTQASALTLQTARQSGTSQQAATPPPQPRRKPERAGWRAR